MTKERYTLLNAGDLKKQDTNDADGKSDVGEKKEAFWWQNPEFGKKVDFNNFLGQRYDKGIDRYDGREGDLASARELLEKHDIKGIAPENINSFWFVRMAYRRMTEADWQEIRNSDQKLLTLYSIVNSYFMQGSVYDSIDSRTRPWGIESNIATSQDVGEMAKLPLVYQTNFDTLERIIESGAVISDKEVYDKLIADGYDPTDSTHAHLFKKTRTYGEDRIAGLDNYVFTYFGRPHTARMYGEIEILFKPDTLFRDQRSFATKNDYCDILGEETTGHSSADDYYRDQVIQGRHLLRTTAAIVKADTRGSDGAELRRNFLSGKHEQKNILEEVTFSTWEVKVPTLTVEDIDSIVFSNPSDLKKFKDKYGNRFRLVLKPDRIALLDEIKKLFNVNLYGVPDQKLFEWARKIPELQDIFSPDADVKIETDLDKIYQLSDAEQRYEKWVRKDLEKGGEMRIKRVREADEAERVSLYITLDFPAKYISEKSDIYKMRPGYIFYSQERAVEHLKSTQTNNAIGNGQAKEEDKTVIAKVTTLKDEYEWTEKNLRDPNDSQKAKQLEHYTIDNIKEVAV